MNTGGHEAIKEAGFHISVLYEDNHMLVVEKPVNILSQGDETGDPDLLDILKGFLKHKYNKPGEAYVGLVHRLDRPVGGVMVFAKTSKSASRLSDQIRKNEFEKTYLAVVHGVPDMQCKRMEHYLLKDSRTNIVRAVPQSKEEGKKAILEYEVLGHRDNLSLVKINLKTGRSHQIRVQFSTEGYPLYGDQKYGRAENKPGQQIALWSHQIICTHPTTKETMVFKSVPPGIYPWNLFTKV